MNAISSFKDDSLNQTDGVSRTNGHLATKVALPEEVQVQSCGCLTVLQQFCYHSGS